MLSAARKYAPPALLRDPGQRLLVEIDILVRHPRAEHGVDPEGRRPLPPDADRIDFDAQGPDRLGGLQRRDVAGIVPPVGEQDQDAGLGLDVLQPLAGQGDGVADGGPVAGHADLQLVHQVEQQPLVEGQRALGERLVPEDHQTDPVPLSLDDEVLHDFLDRRETIHGIAVDLEVHRAHRAGGVEAEHDVDAGGLGFP